MAHLRDKAREHLGPRALLYTTDGSGDGFLKCGTVPGAYVTVDFGNSCKLFKIAQNMTKIRDFFYNVWSSVVLYIYMYFCLFQEKFEVLNS